MDPDYLLKTYTTGSERPIPGSKLYKGVPNALKTIRDGMEGKLIRYPLRWPSVNKMLIGGLYRQMNYLVGGGSGHGKSYLASMMIKDVLNPLLNPNAADTIVIWFSFEMSSEMNALRSIGGRFGLSMGDLWSADRPLSEAMYREIEKESENLINRNIGIVEYPMTIGEMTKHLVKVRKRNPSKHIVAVYDHTLLIRQGKGQDEMDVMVELAKVSIDWRDVLGVTNIFLAQLNDKIESEKRRSDESAHLHFPMKTDIHGSKQIYHSMDDVMIVHQPALLELTTYGPRRVPTEGLVALHKIKGRHGNVGVVYLNNDLSKGTFSERNMNAAPPRQEGGGYQRLNT